MQSPFASDHDLIVALSQGNEHALTEIFRRYWKPMYFTAYQKLQSHEQAEEIVQELFTELWDKRIVLFTRSRENFHLASYLRQAVKNKSLNQIRRQLYDRKYWEYCQKHLDKTESRTHELAEYNDLQENLNNALGRLSDKTREVFVMHNQGISVLEIAKVLNLSEKAIGYHLTKSLKELRSHLKDFK